jgi:hypothetical protein
VRSSPIPGYIGRQVWNKQRKDNVLLDVNDVALGHVTKMRWNDDAKWIYSDHVVHPPIIDDQTFEQARLLLAAKQAREVVRRPAGLPAAGRPRGHHPAHQAAHRGLATTAPASPGHQSAASSFARPQARPGIQQHRLPTGNVLPGMLTPAAAQIIRVWSVTAAQVAVR